MPWVVCKRATRRAARRVITSSFISVAGNAPSVAKFIVLRGAILSLYPAHCEGAGLMQEMSETSASTAVHARLSGLHRFICATSIDEYCSGYTNQLTILKFASFSSSCVVYVQIKNRKLPYIGIDLCGGQTS